MFWLVRCAVAIGILYWLSPLRGPEPGLADLQRVETSWREASGALKALPTESFARDAAMAALSGLRRPLGTRDAASTKP
jgi:hypothetical protein